MSLNWKEINLVLEELNLSGGEPQFGSAAPSGMRIQKAIQSAYDLLFLKLYGKNGAKTLLISISPGACRLHETLYPISKNPKPLRFAEFLNSKIINSKIEEAIQLGSDRIVRLLVSHGEDQFYIYIRLWSNAANVIVTDMDGKILDAMRRLPKKNEVTGGYYKPDIPPDSSADNLNNSNSKQYTIRSFPSDLLSELPKDASVCQKIDALYRREGGALSLEALQEEVRRKYEGKINRLGASIEKLKEKKSDFENADRYKTYGDLILSSLKDIAPRAEWLETESFAGEKINPDNSTIESQKIRIKLDPGKSPAASAEEYYEQYRKAKSGLKEIQSEIEEGEKELKKLEELKAKLLSETNPLVLHKLLKYQGKEISLPGKKEPKRPGLSFRRKDWLILVGRDSSENDELLRKHVKGNDLWLHARDFPGSYVFIKNKPGKTVPLDILLDAGNLAIFYSKGRNSGKGDLFYTHVKYLRRPKNGPKGLVLPTQEKNLHVKVDNGILKELEECKL